MGLVTESNRVRAFRLRIAKDIPKFPNDRASLQALQSKSLRALLIDYGNWKIRLHRAACARCSGRVRNTLYVLRINAEKRT